MAKTRKILLIVLSCILGIVIVVGVFGAIIGFNFKDIGGGKVEKETTNIIGSYKNIEVSEVAGSVEIVNLKSGSSRVETYKKGKLYVDTIGSPDKETLTIKLVDERKWYEKLFTNDGALKTTVYLSSSELDTIKVKTVSGAISVLGDFDVDIVKLSSTSGSIKCETTANDSMLVSSTSGDVTIKGVGGDSVSAKTTSGAITLDRITAKTLNAESVSGRIEILNSDVVNKLVAKTTSGKIDFNYADAKEMFFYSDSGSISGKVIKSKKIATNTTSGKVTITDECKYEKGELLALTTTSGRITVEMYGEVAE